MEKKYFTFGNHNIHFIMMFFDANCIKYEKQQKDGYLGEIPKLIFNADENTIKKIEKEFPTTAFHEINEY